MGNFNRKILKEDENWFEDLPELIKTNPLNIKVGDRVVVNGYSDTIEFDHERGTVISTLIEGSINVFLIKFDKWWGSEGNTYSPFYPIENDVCNGYCWSFSRRNDDYDFYVERTRKPIKENDEWFNDVLTSDEYFTVPYEMLIPGTDIIVNGHDNIDEFDYIMKEGRIISMVKHMGNDVILVKFKNFRAPFDVVKSSGDYWLKHKEECEGKKCMSFMRQVDLNCDDYDRENCTFEFLIRNPSYKNNINEEMIRKKFQISLPNSILKIKDIFKQNGHQLYVVGGAVRDALLGRRPKDFDLATDATPDKIKSMLSMYRTIDMGEQFAIVNVITEDGQYEIATFRKDIGKGRRPDSVEFTTIDQDVLRRDLTINALFYDIDSGEIVDLVGGMEDLEKNIIKTVGSASERFDEDKLRILRAIRFAARVGSTLDPDIENAIKKDKTPVSGNGLSLSQERIKDEFVKGIKQAKSSAYLVQLITKYNLWDWVFGRLVVTTEPLIETRIPVVLIASLLRNNDVKLLERILVNDLKYSSDETREITFLISLLNLNPSNAFKLREKLDSFKMNENFIIDFSKLNGLDMGLIKTFLKYKITTSGNELMRRGFVGREIGVEKERLEKEKFEELLKKLTKKVSYSGIILTENSRKDLLQYIKVPEGWDVLAHHMTIDLGPLRNEYRPLLGQSFDLLVTHVGYTDKVLAVKIDTQFSTKNDYPHITVAVNREAGGRPMTSNEITNWISVYPFELEGVLEEVSL